VREALGPLYQQRQLAFVPFAGTDDLSRSHFETQDSIELGEPSRGQHDFSSGFMGRLVDVLGSSGSIAFTDALPLTFKGAADIPNVSLKGIGKAAFDQRQTSLLTGMYAEHHLEAAVADGLELRQEVALAMADEMLAANRGAINTKGFALEAERMGKLMRDQYRIGFVDVGGWDTHVNEGGAKGALANNLDNLSRGLVSFSQAGEPSARTATTAPITGMVRCIGCWAAPSAVVALPANSSRFSAQRCFRTVTIRC
jgi:uncharacterized protein (DUF1501 family)